MARISIIAVAALLWLWLFSAWLTHVVICIKTGAWLLLIAGAVVVPIGVVHGTGIWFGVW